MQEEKRKPTSYRGIMAMLAPVFLPFAWVMALLVILSVAIAGLNVAEPYIYGSIIDSVTASVSSHLGADAGFAAILPYLSWWVVVVFLGSLLIALHFWILWYVGNRFEQVFGEKLFRRALSLTVQRFQDERAGAMLNRFANGKEALFQLTVTLFRSFIQSGVTFLVIVIAGWYIDWRLMLAALAIVPVDVLIGIVNLHISLKRQDRMNDKWEETTGLAGDSFSNITTVQSEAGEGLVAARFAKTYFQVMREQLKLNVQWAFVEAGTGGIYIAGRLLIFFVGIRLVLDGTTSLGTLIMFLGFAGFLYGTVQTMLQSLPDLARSLNRLDRVARIWHEVPEIRDRDRARKAPALQGEVEFADVSFSYKDGNTHVLRSVSFTIPAGKTFAIIGESGAGKSTLAKLMVRFADPTKGAIKVDGTDLRDFTLASLRPQVGFVMQENLLFHDSILYNVKFAKPNATRDEVIAAAKRAQAHDFITKLPKGYDTVVGERGVKLSGGQKQRIALARVLLANPPILVLDEATSALDSKTEHDLQQALREVKKGRTTIVIAHRLSTVMDADNILVMDKGKIVDQGRHEDLIKRDNLYRQFWEIQAGGYV